MVIISGIKTHKSLTTIQSCTEREIRQLYEWQVDRINGNALWSHSVCTSSRTERRIDSLSFPDDELKI